MRYSTKKMNKETTEVQLSPHDCSSSQFAKCTTAQHNLLQHQSLNAIRELSFKISKDLCNRNSANNKEQCFAFINSIMRL